MRHADKRGMPGSFCFSVLSSGWHGRKILQSQCGWLPVPLAELFNSYWPEARTR